MKIFVIGILCTGALFAYWYVIFSWDKLNAPNKSRSIPYSSRTIRAPTYKGYKCTKDCTGHEAGYNWAQEKGICDPGDCGGKSQCL